jgi:hypothetical protein
MAITLKQLIAWLKTWGACQAMIDWLEGLPPDTPLRVVWETCPVGDWAIRVLEGLGADPRRLTWLACEIIRKTPIGDGRTVWNLLTDERSRKAVKVAEFWSRGEASDEELEDAASDAASAGARAVAYADSADAYAAYAAADAAALAAASAAARAAYAAAARAAAQQFAADVVREEFTFEEVEALLTAAIAAERE